MHEKTELQIRRERHPSVAQTRWLSPGTAIHLGQRPGELTVLAGRAWLTRSDDVADYILLPGEHVLLEQAHGAVMESATKGHGVAYCWRLRGGYLADLERCSPQPTTAAAPCCRPALGPGSAGTARTPLASPALVLPETSLLRTLQQNFRTVKDGDGGRT